MELTIDKQAFLNRLARANHIADRKSTMHVLANVLLTTEGSTALRVSATDLYMGVTSAAPAVVKKQGAVAVSAKTLFEIVKNLPDGEIQWKQLDSHAMQLSSGKVLYKIPSVPGDDFPPLPNAEQAEFVEVDPSAIADLVSMTQYSMSHDDSRPHLAGTLFEGDGKILRMVTTDGHRLSKAERKLSGASMMNFTMLIPHKAVTELRRLVDDGKVSSSREDGPQKLAIGKAGSDVFFKTNSFTFNAKLANEQFPPYDRVIPSKQTRIVSVSRAMFSEALRRIALVANDKNGGVHLEIEEGTIRLHSQNADVGEGTEEIAAAYAGDPLKIGFNARYLLDALSAVTTDEVTFELGGDRDPGVLRPIGGETDFIGVIMPMRI